MDKSAGSRATDFSKDDKPIVLEKYEEATYIIQT